MAALLPAHRALPRRAEPDPLLPPWPCRDPGFKEGARRRKRDAGVCYKACFAFSNRQGRSDSRSLVYFSIDPHAYRYAVIVWSYLAFSAREAS
jgi:hypothetical protein